MTKSSSVFSIFWVVLVVVSWETAKVNCLLKKPNVGLVAVLRNLLTPPPEKKHTTCQLISFSNKPAACAIPQAPRVRTQT